MTVTRTTLLDLPIIATGTESGTWGNITNNALTQYLDIAIAGSLVLSTDADVTLASTEGDSSATNIGSTTAQYSILRCTGSRTGTTNINAPAWAVSGGTIANYSKTYLVVNETTGGHAVVLRATNSATPTFTTGVTIANGERALCTWNGSDFVIIGATINNIVPVARGGTGANTLTSNNVILGNGTSAVQFVAPGSNGNVLTSNGTTWTSAAAASALSGETQSTTPFETSLGSGAGAVNTGVNNVFVGFEAGNDNTTGTNNTAVGYQALDANTTGASNTAVGSGSLGANTTGLQNTGLGASSLAANTTGNYNTAVGFQSLLVNTSGSENVSVGAYSMTANTSGLRNTAVGYGVMAANTTGNDNAAFGRQALVANTTGNNNTALGYFALGSNTTGFANTAVGAYALDANTTGELNVAIGFDALGGNTTGSQNTVNGYRTMLFNTTGSNNTAYGSRALEANTTASNNVAIGRASLYANTAGADNTAVGTDALTNNTTASNNTAIGRSALQANTTGAYNTAVGHNAADVVTTAQDITAVGRDAGGGCTTGTDNTFLGANAGANITTGASNVFVGRNCSASAAGGTNQIVIGPNVVGQADTNVTIGNGTGKIYNAYTVNATWTQTSDERLKKNIQEDTLGLSFINRLRPVKYQWKPSYEIDPSLPYYKEENNRDTETVMHGLVAQEVKAALDAEGVTTFAGWDVGPDTIQAISREMFVSPLIKAIQELSAQVTALQAEVNTLKGN